jgi:hypothetical protein
MPKEGESLKEHALTPANIVFDAADLLFTIAVSPVRPGHPIRSLTI